jgi:hypothetical protein
MLATISQSGDTANRVRARSSTVKAIVSISNANLSI